MLEGADGEFELDFESLDDGTIRKIDVFLRQIFPGVPVAGPAPAGGAGGGSRGRKGVSHDDDDVQDDDDDDVSMGDLDDESDDD